MKQWEILTTGVSLHRYAVPDYKLFPLRCAYDTQLLVIDVYRINEHCPSSDGLYAGQMVVNCTDMRNAAVSWLRDDVPVDLATRILDWLDSDV